MKAQDQIARLNSGEHGVTYELLQVDPARRPITGEVRYLVTLIASPDPGAMLPMDPVAIIWTGKEWMK